MADKIIQRASEEPASTPRCNEPAISQVSDISLTMGAFHSRRERSTRQIWGHGGHVGPDLADPMIQAIMTSRRKKRANAQNFRKWRRRLWLKQLF